MKTNENNLANRPAATVLLELRDIHATGKLIFSRGADKIDVALINGEVAYIATSQPDRRLGEYLLQEGSIRLRDYLDSVNALLETGQRQGDFLLEARRLEKNELKKAIRGHMREVIDWLLLWDQGDYHFKESTIQEEPFQLSVSTNELILRGMAQCKQYSAIRDTLAPWARMCKIDGAIDPEEAKRVRLKEDEAAIIRLVDGSLSILDIIKVAPMVDFRAMQLLYALYWAQIIRFEDQD